MRFQLGYRPELDGIRALAVLVVMFYHLQDFPLFNGGHVGVDIFLVLSGFLITSLLLTEWEANSRINLPAFYIRRTLRLLPALFTMVAILVVFTWLFQEADFFSDDSRDFQSIPVAAIAALTYSSNWLIALKVEYLGPLTHTWTLAMEEQFYVVWPVLLLLLLKHGVRLQVLVMALILAVIAIGLWRFMLWSEVDVYRAHYGPDARADALVMGCLVAVLAHQHLLTPLVRAVGPILPTVALLFLVYASWSISVWTAPVYYGVGSLLGICVALCLAYVVAAPQSGYFHRLLSQKPLVALGRISYGLYLWHVPVYFFVDGDSPETWAAEFLLSFLLAGASFLIVERPSLRLRGHFSRQRMRDSQGTVLPAVTAG